MTPDEHIAALRELKARDPEGFALVRRTVFKVGRPPGMTPKRERDCFSWIGYSLLLPQHGDAKAFAIALREGGGDPLTLRQTINRPRGGGDVKKDANRMLESDDNERLDNFLSRLSDYISV